jgi:transcriptional regulator with XRE-family HTH domain
MDDLQFGAVIRAIRRRRRMSQDRLGGLAGVSSGTVSLVERGHCESLSPRVVRRLAAAMDARLKLLARWRGGELDRFLSRRHSTLGESFASFLIAQPGWVVEPEASFSIYGERRVVDQPDWHEASAHVLVIELNTEFVDRLRDGSPTARGGPMGSGQARIQPISGRSGPDAALAVPADKPRPT